ncbi:MULTISPECIES: 4-hydroxythreonine-4-phosphate dehydrogenase PdxA [Pandoraea]|uniref:4-hydroxythreonine-4-phosphate dehydrogenase PdxA n=1 Tax=Pandoraea TaxID=93217 RepID=UPI001F5D334A|nr:MULTISPECIES: 4-hydroxythreonine-4-phosphate dehydrogenase PdxA [Pandoraea]MCI3206396.1 4-hydroxythreonine-4-phosphate dehydrogenase [Pandoraea sp. LA3]MDN4584424.1 4-hydroxythreonine-4-phosphate dehydrogenase [Pandoraea capi]
MPQSMLPSLKPLAILLGDPAGVGPEMAARLLSDAGNRARMPLLVIGDACVWEAAQRIADTRVDTLTARSLADIRYERDKVSLLDIDALKGELPALGQCSELAGRASFEALEHAVELAVQEAVSGILFAPLNKHSLRLGGLQAEDELRHMQLRFGVRSFVCEFNITGALWTSRVTSHVPLRDVASHLSREGVLEAARIIDTALRRAGVAQPRIAVCGLNPHAGDSGSIGMEEIEVIAPAIRDAQAQGIGASGPYPSDTVFLAAQRGDFDAVVCMYHDQGQIAMKLMGFDHGVTFHGGLPVPVATSASGSAFDIAGKGIANIQGLQRAFDICTRVAVSSQMAA